MNESAEIPDVEPAKKAPSPNQPETELKPAIPSTPEKASPEPTQDRLAEVRTNIRNAIPSKETPPLASPVVAPHNEPSTYSLPERFKNVIFNRTNLIAATMTAEGAAFIPTFLVAKYLTSSFLLEAVGFPTLFALMWWSGIKLAQKGHTLSEFVLYFPRTTLLRKNTPVGSLNFGEVWAELHMSSNVGKMSDLSFKQRVPALALDGLTSLQTLARLIEQKNSQVAKIKAFKAHSHLVGQYPELFKRLGFTVEGKPPGFLDKMAGVFSKGFFAFIWGPRQLLRERSIRGFREAFNLKTGKRTTAWITPQDLVEHKGQIEEKLQYFRKLAERAQR